MKLELAFIACFGVSFVAGYSAALGPPDPKIEAIHVLKRNVAGTCVTRPEVIAESQRLLPDNNDGLITPVDIRQIVNDVVNRC